MVWWAKPSSWVPTCPISLIRTSSLLPRRLDGWFMNVRLVCTSKRRVPKNGIEALSTWPSSMISPDLMSRVARSTDSDFMWLPEPRSSAAPPPPLGGSARAGRGGAQGRGIEGGAGRAERDHQGHAEHDRSHGGLL